MKSIVYLQCVYRKVPLLYNALPDTTLVASYDTQGYGTPILTGAYTGPSTLVLTTVMGSDLVYILYILYTHTLPQIQSYIFVQHVKMEWHWDDKHLIDALATVIKY